MRELRDIVVDLARAQMGLSGAYFKYLLALSEEAEWARTFGLSFATEVVAAADRTCQEVVTAKMKVDELLTELTQTVSV